MLTSTEGEDKREIVVGNGKLHRMIDPARLRLLLALHEGGTLHAAAATLHISPSAASQQLATLAREAGAPLTEADGRRLRLTDAGRVLVDHAYVLLADLERARGAVQSTVTGELGTLVVGSFPSTIASLLIPAVRQLRESRPSLRVDVREIKVPDCLAELTGGELDVVVAIEAAGAPAAEDPRFARVSLGTDDVDVALPAGHRLAGEDVVDLGLLADDDWVSTIEGDSCDQLLLLACACAGFRPRVRHRSGDWMAMLALVEAGMGVASVPRAGGFPVPDGVVTRTTSGHDIRRHVYAAFRRGADSRPAVAAFLDAVADVARQATR